MPLPTAYTAATLATYMVRTLTSVSTYLGWTEESWEVQEAVTDVAIALDVADVAAWDASTRANLGKVRVLADVAILRRAKVAAAPRYDLAEDQQQHSRSQAFVAISAALADAENRAAAVGVLDTYAVGVSSLRYVDDPYAYVPEELRTV